MHTDIDRMISTDATERDNDETTDADPVRTEKRRRSREGLATLLPMAIAGLLVVGVLLFDQLGPTTDRRATVTATFTERSGRRGRNTDHIVAGIDDRGGRFELTVPKGDWSRADVGEEIVVSRAVLTGRVVDVHDTDGWGMHTTNRIVALSIVFAVALAVCVGTAIALRVTRVPQTAQRRRFERAWLVGASAAALVGVSIYVIVERSEAHASGGDATDITAVVDPASVAAECRRGLAGVDAILMTFTTDGSLTLDEVGIVRALGASAGPDCSGELQRMICATTNPASLTPVRIDVAIGC